MGIDSASFWNDRPAEPEGRWKVGRLCLALADGQSFAFEVNEDDGPDGRDALGAWLRMMREALARAVKATADVAVVRFGRLAEASTWGAPKALHDGLLESHPIRVDAGFEGNPGVDGGAWRPADGGDDGFVHLRFAAGTEDLPLHVHEFSDRLLVVTSGIGWFHYLPAETTRALRSVVVEAGDAVLFTRGVVHTFTAPLGVLTLLSYDTPFIDLDDTRKVHDPPADHRRDLVVEGLRLVVASRPGGYDRIPKSSCRCIRRSWM